MLHPHDLRHVSRVQGQRFHALALPFPVDERIVGVEPHHAAGVPDGPQLIVRQVPGHVAKGAAVGVGGDHHAALQPHHVPEAPLVQVGHVHHYACPAHVLHCLPPQSREAVGRVAARTGGQGVFLIPGEHAHPGTESGVAVDPVQVLPCRGHALHAQKGVPLPGSTGCTGLRRRPHHRQPGALGKLGPGAVHHLRRPLCYGAAVRLFPECLSRRRRPQREHHALHAAPAQIIQVMPLQHVGLAPEAAPRHII